MQECTNWKGSASLHVFQMKYLIFLQSEIEVDKIPVPDGRCRIQLEVVLVRRWVIGVLGIWRGEGLGKGLGEGRSVYKQPETEVDGSCHS